MSLLDDIWSWSSEFLQPWQQDALRRLFQHQTLSDADYQDLFALLKAEHGIADPQERRSVPLASEQLPASSNDKAPLQLKTIRDLKNVNMLADQQSINISPEGMTIIYGGNGSGKSKYSRVLKRACRARDQAEHVLPNVFDNNQDYNSPSAKFDVLIADQEKEISWIQDMPAPPEMSDIAVFDTRCARVYLDSEQEMAYMPYGLDILEGLAQNVFPRLSSMLEIEIAQLNCDVSPYHVNMRDTKAGQALRAICSNTEESFLRELSCYRDSDAERLHDLESILSESDPVEKAKSLRNLSKRLRSLNESITRAISLVDEGGYSRARRADEEVQETESAIEHAAKILRSGEMLFDGTGDLVWRMLYLAAERFAIMHAYPDCEFPNVSIGAKCPFCQQELNESTLNRLARFKEFIAADVVKVAKEKQLHRSNLLKEAESCTIILDWDLPLRTEMAEFNANLPEEISEFERALIAAKNQILECIQTHIWVEQIPLPGDPRKAIEVIIGRVEAEAGELEALGDQEARKTLMNERDELLDQKTLNMQIENVLHILSNLKTKALRGSAWESVLSVM